MGQGVNTDSSETRKVGKLFSNFYLSHFSCFPYAKFENTDKIFHFFKTKAKFPNFNKENIFQFFKNVENIFQFFENMENIFQFFENTENIFQVFENTENKHNTLSAKKEKNYPNTYLHISYIKS